MKTQETGKFGNTREIMFRQKAFQNKQQSCDLYQHTETALNNYIRKKQKKKKKRNFQNPYFDTET